MGLIWVRFNRGSLRRLDEIKGELIQRGGRGGWIFTGAVQVFVVQVLPGITVMRTGIRISTMYRWGRERGKNTSEAANQTHN
jgi:hypothetical protein